MKVGLVAEEGQQLSLFVEVILVAGELGSLVLEMDDLEMKVSLKYVDFSYFW